MEFAILEPPMQDKEEEATIIVLAYQYKKAKQAGSTYFCSIILSVEIYFYRERLRVPRVRNVLTINVPVWRST